VCAGKRSIKSGDEGGTPAKKKHPEEDARPRGFDRGLQVRLFILLGLEREGLIQCSGSEIKN